MRYGFVLPGGSAPEQVELAMLADRAGWDAVFVWEGGYVVDAWTLLGGMAMRTERVRLGTMLTPLPWRRPWKLAAQVATLDQLSHGRAILAVGLGAVDTGLGTYPEVADRRERARLLDEGIDIVRGLWDGEATIGPLDLSTSMNPLPRPVQARIPIWCVGAKDRRPSMARILRCDGLLPTVIGDDGGRLPDLDELRETVAGLAEEGWHGDVVMEGETAVDTMRDVTAPLAAAGATWWLETRWGTDDADVVRRRIEAGPVPSNE